MRWPWTKRPERSDFKKRCDAAAQIHAWGERMDAYLALMQENPEEYLEWAREAVR